MLFWVFDGLGFLCLVFSWVFGVLLVRFGWGVGGFGISTRGVGGVGFAPAGVAVILGVGWFEWWFVGGCFALLFVWVIS